MRAKINAIAASTWQVCIFAVALVAISSCSAFASNAITKVDVVNHANRIVISVQGNHALSMVPIKSTAGKYLGFQFPSALQAKSNTVGIYSGAIHCVKYNNFTSKPPASRIVVNTTTSLEYTTEWENDKKSLNITVYKQGFKPVAAVNTPATPSTPPVSANVAEPRVRITDQSRPAGSVLAALGAGPSTAYEMSAAQPPVTTRVMGMVETKRSEPLRVAQAIGIPAANPRITVEVKTDADERPAVRTPVPAEPEKRVSLNFLGADINDVLKALSLQSGKNIVANKDVKGEITVSLNEVTIKEALDYVARLSGYGYKLENGVYLIASKDVLRSMSADGTSTSTTELVKLTYANSEDIIALVKAQFPDVQISKIGVDLTGPVAVRAKAGQTTLGLQNSLLVLIGPDESVRLAKDLIVKFEDAFKVETIESTKALYRIKHVDAVDLANTLAALVPGIAINYLPTEGFDLTGPKSIEVSTFGSAVSMDNSDKQTKNIAAGQASVDSVGNISANDAAVNTSSTVGKIGDKKRPQGLIISGREDDVLKALELAEEYDTKSPMINIEAKVTSINKTAAQKLGLKWDWSGFSFTELIELVSLPPTDAAGAPLSGFDPVTRPTDKYVRSPMTVVGLLDALATDGNARVLAAPNLLCLEGKPGVFFVGDEVTYIQRIETTPTGQNITTDTKQVGVQLRVVGDVSPDGYITLNLHPEVSVLKLTVDQGISLPLVSRRFTDHIVRVKNGDTIAIGGLIRSDEIHDLNKVPILGDLPFLGKLFQHKSKSTSETEVVMFITARVVQD